MTDSVENHSRAIGAGRFLYEPVTYRATDGSWRRDYFDALRRSDGQVTWDPAAILSILSFNYACGNRTLLSEITRKPWLAEIGADGQAELLDIPPHGRAFISHATIAEKLERLVREEIVSACRGRSRIYVLLSGGLDSRIVAGVTARARDEGRIDAPVTAITWGLDDSRDVAYGRAAAEMLGLEWQHVDLGPEHLLENVECAARAAAGLVSPVHLHRMAWFENAEDDALVLAASYGDMVGRAEFSGVHLLELEYLSPLERCELMTPAAYACGRELLLADLKALRDRAAGQPQYVQCEHEMHAHYTRGLLGQAMNVINNYCTAYQAFTHPNVYGYMWSIHPSLRTNEVYALLLRRLGPRLASFPWARTNRALAGRTRGADKNLRPRAHEYTRWIAGPLFERLYDRLDVEWFGQTGVFQTEAIANLCERIRNGTAEKSACEQFIWLVGLRRFARLVEESGRAVLAPEVGQHARVAPASVAAPPGPARRFRERLGRSAFLTRCYKRLRPVRRYLLRRKALKLYPPDKRS